MEVTTIAMLFGAGVIGGSLSGIVGGASLVTFPALLAAGLPPVTAAASNVCSMMFANIAAALSDRAMLPKADRSLAGLIAASIGGALIGASLLVITPQRVFEVLVPLLIGFATVLFALSPPISAWLRARAERGGRQAPRVGAGSIPMMLPVSVYGGYFGAGVGVLALAVMSIGTGGEYRAANVVKNIVMALNTVAAAAVLAWQGAVDWPPTLVMMLGASFGGMMGGSLGRYIPQEVMRVGIIGFGALLTGIFVWRYWL
ncbi:MAG: sulfite exporter TauE/SafE family protein [Xanthobacteraceae bacterium]